MFEKRLWICFDCLLIHALTRVQITALSHNWYIEIYCTMFDIESEVFSIYSFFTQALKKWIWSMVKIRLLVTLMRSVFKFNEINVIIDYSYEILTIENSVHIHSIYCSFTQTQKRLRLLGCLWAITSESAYSIVLCMRFKM